MASSYYDSIGKNVTNGDLSDETDINDINSAVDTAFQLVESDITSIANDAVVYAGIAQKWAENPEDVQVEPGAYSALHWSAKSEGFASNASTSASNAATSAANALTSETNAAASESAASISAGIAEAHANEALTYKNAANFAAINAAASESNAATSATNALASENKAQEWAENPEDVEVEVGQYSALHWAAKSQAAAASISDIAYGDTWNGVTNVAPSKNAIYDKVEALRYGGQLISAEQSSQTIIAHPAYSNDVDNIVYPGRWTCLGTDANVPVAEAGIILVEHNSLSDRVRQTYKNINRVSTSGNVTYVRTSNDGGMTWGSWYGEFAAKAWLLLNGTGTIAIRGSANISSVTDVGTGQYDVTFSTAMSSADYSAVACGPSTADSNRCLVSVRNFVSTGCRLYSHSTAGSSNYDQDYISLTVTTY